MKNFKIILELQSPETLFLQNLHTELFVKKNFMLKIVPKTWQTWTLSNNNISTLRSPHVNKNAQEHFQLVKQKRRYYFYCNTVISTVKIKEHFLMTINTIRIYNLITFKYKIENTKIGFSSHF